MRESHDDVGWGMRVMWAGGDVSIRTNRFTDLMTFV